MHKQEQFHTKELVQNTTTMDTVKWWRKHILWKKKPQYTLLFMSIKNALVF